VNHISIEHGVRYQPQAAGSYSAVLQSWLAIYIEALQRGRDRGCSLAAERSAAPYLAPESLFATRRTAELAERQRRNAPHRSILVRWGIGAITVSGDTATAVTQETWSNQEAGAVAAEQATVRVTYTLRWDTAARRWLIVDTSQMPL
jgi:hypothetical protein